MSFGMVLVGVPLFQCEAINRYFWRFEIAEPTNSSAHVFRIFPKHTAGHIAWRAKNAPYKARVAYFFGVIMVNMTVNTARSWNDEFSTNTASAFLLF